MTEKKLEETKTEPQTPKTKRKSRKGTRPVHPKGTIDKDGNTKANRIDKYEPWFPSRDDYDMIFESILKGVSMREIIANIGITHQTFYAKMRSTHPRMLDGEGANKLRTTVDTARTALGNEIENTILAKALNPQHKDHVKCAFWYLEKVLKYGTDDEPKVIVVQGNQQLDPKAVSEVLKQARRKDLKTYDNNELNTQNNTSNES